MMFALVMPAQADKIISKTVPLQAVQRISLEGPHDLKVTQGDKAYVRIKAPQHVLASISAEVRGDKLRLRHKRQGFVMGLFDFAPGAKFEVQLPKLTELRVEGSGDVELGDFEVDELSLQVAGSNEVLIGDLSGQSFNAELAGASEVHMGDLFFSGPITVEVAGSSEVYSGKVKSPQQITFDVSGSAELMIASVEAELLNMDIAGSAEVHIDEPGKVSKQRIDMAGACEYLARDTVSQMAIVDVAGSSNLEIHVTEQLSLDVMGTASVGYLGQPSIDSDVGGSSEVYRLDDHETE